MALYTVDSNEETVGRFMEMTEIESCATVQSIIKDHVGSASTVSAYRYHLRVLYFWYIRELLKETTLENNYQF